MSGVLRSRQLMLDQYLPMLCPCMIYRPGSGSSSEVKLWEKHLCDVLLGSITAHPHNSVLGAELLWQVRQHLRLVHHDLRWMNICTCTGHFKPGFTMSEVKSETSCNSVFESILKVFCSHSVSGLGEVTQYLSPDIWLACLVQLSLA